MVILICLSIIAIIASFYLIEYNEEQMMWLMVAIIILLVVLLTNEALNGCNFNEIKAFSQDIQSEGCFEYKQKMEAFLDPS